MTLKIKVCGITNEKEMKEIEKLNVDRIGFINIERSKRNVSLEEIEILEKKLLNKRLSTIVLEPNNAYEALLKANRTKIFNLQLHSLTCFDIRYMTWLNQYHNGERLNITKVIGLRDKINRKDEKEIKNHCLYSDNILFDYVKDGKTGGTNTHIPIDTAIEASRLVKKYDNRTEVTLAGGLNLEYLEEIYDKLHYFDRIDLNSGVEDKPGRKNIKEIKKIIKLVNEE
ncbi:phosphoribosylanthranilate isomerase [Candidatus Methanosphaera massiliense]|jgi:phosphoribosylanthranilate isomerase|uniref:phosphoribosylanthranilate isomerase n=1 Tax=Methanosphaera TaxID=2316 RepID=UPI0023809E79|nr:phosphoribosylanthranilate isomerase [Candidatus Methanosphaera massiliense]MDD6285411.1 phosphoribosylanthranilate isomerase [Methanobacteriaceae archaeon]MDE4077465.1 phosphoribosylanthranilate isomerase [Candidatus Methanosphaera massiliense]